MEIWTDLVRPLLVELPPADQRAFIRSIDRPRDEQLDGKLHRVPRRRRDGNGLHGRSECAE